MSLRSVLNKMQRTLGDVSAIQRGSATGYAKRLGRRKLRTVIGRGLNRLPGRW